MDMRTGAYASGAIEMGLLNAAVAQLAQFYGIPIYATGGLTDSKIPDAQAGYEKALTTILAALAGANYIHDAVGLLESALTVSYEQMVIDDEILGMVIRGLEGIEIDKDTLACDLIDKVGPSGHYLAEAHTRRYHRREHFLPTISDRKGRTAWKKEGGKDARQRAVEKATELLAEHRPEPLPEGVDAELKEILQEAKKKYL